MSNNTATKSEILAIIDTIEGMLRIKWDAYLLGERTKWLGRLAQTEGR